MFGAVPVVAGAEMSNRVSVDTTLVAPGLLMSVVESEARFGDLPLDEYRARMSPEAFATFVRFAGLVSSGGPRLDMVRFTEVPEEPS